MYAHLRISLIIIISLGLQGCLGSIIGTTADVAIEVIKVPFKVGGAVVDVVTGDELTDTSSQLNESESDDNANYRIENQGIR